MILPMALAAALSFAAPETADRIIDVSEPALMADALREAGYKALVKTGKTGAQYITSAVNGNEFSIEFYDCKVGKDCTSYQFFTWYKQDPIFDAAFINEWNSKKRWLKIFIDSDGDLSMSMDSSSLGKVTYANFVDQVEWFSAMDAEFTKFLAEKQAAKKAKATPAAAK